MTREELKDALANLHDGTIAGRYKSYKAMVMDITVPVEHHASCHNAFYSGASSAVAVLKALASDAPSPEAKAQYQAVIQELLTFNLQLMKTTLTDEGTAH